MVSGRKQDKIDYRNGIRRGVLDSSVHPFFTRRSLNDEPAFKKIVDNLEELSDYSKRNYLHAYDLGAFDDMEVFSNGYRVGARIGLNASVLSLGIWNVIANVIDVRARLSEKRLEKRY